MTKLTAAKADPHSAEKIMAVPRLVDIMNRLGWKNSARILEAAEGVGEDAGMCLKFLDRVTEDEDIRSYSGRKIFPLSQIRALVESLSEPDLAKTEGPNDRKLAELDRQIRDDRLDEAHPLDPEKTEKPK